MEAPTPPTDANPLDSRTPPAKNSAMLCELCETDEAISFHHFIPRTLHRNKWFKKRFDTQAMRTSGMQVCKQCHGMLHELIPHKQLGREYNSLDAIKSHEKIAGYLRWKQRRIRRDASHSESDS